MRAFTLKRKKAFMLLEVLSVSVLLGAFLVCFYEGMQVMGILNLSQQVQNEALMRTRQVAMAWKTGVAAPASTVGQFTCGVPYTLSSVVTAYTGGASTLTRLSISLSWRQPRADSIAPAVKTYKHVSFKY